MKKIIIAPDSFKGTLSAAEVCDIIEAVARQFFPDIEINKMPIADGGEGLVDAMLRWRPDPGAYAKIKATVKDPLFRDIEASYGILSNGTAIIEMAAASGLTLLSSQERNVLKTTTFGTGQLILDALQRGCREFILGLGGSATNDGGAGLGAALGIRYCDQTGQEIRSGEDLIKLDHIDTHAMAKGLLESHLTIACDVKNPLYGPNGAAYIFSPQKGATPPQVEWLDQGLAHLAQVILQATGKDMQTIQGAGAAGGTAVPLIAYTNSSLCKGLDVVLDAIGFDQALDGCDLVMTGEGRTDSQTLMGKVIYGVGQRAKAKGVPVIAISGSLQAGYKDLYPEGITALFSTCRQVCTLDQALSNARQNLQETTEDVFRLIKADIGN